MPPRIGVPLCLDDRGRWRAGRDYHYIDAAYSRALEEVGASVRYLPMQADVANLIRDVDGLLLPGGDDLPPPDTHSYATAGLDPVPPSQLAFDRALLAEAMCRDLPLLGVCYGMQLLALEGEGRLDYHLPSDRPEAPAHRLEPDSRHDVEIASDSRLFGVFGCSRMPVNSWHHQAVAEVGPDWRVSARSPDGVIEAIEWAAPSPKSAFRVGVQWHPEKLAESGGLALFRAFVAAA